MTDRDYPVYYRLQSIKTEAAKRAGQSWRDLWRNVSYRRYPSHGGRWSADTRGVFQGAFFCDRIPDGWRETGDYQAIMRNAGRYLMARHSGWYTDNYQSETYIGFVLQLPARNGAPKYVPAVRHSDWDGITIWPMESHETAEDAAISADRCAELMAEDQREYEAKDSAEQEIAELRQSIAQYRTDRRYLVSTLKELRGIAVPVSDCTRKTVCETVRSRIAKLKNDSAKAFERIGKLEDNYWESVNA